MGNLLGCCSQSDKVIDYTDTAQPETRRSLIGTTIYTRQGKLKK